MNISMNGNHRMVIDACAHTLAYRQLQDVVERLVEERQQQQQTKTTSRRPTTTATLAKILVNEISRNDHGLFKHLEALRQFLVHMQGLFIRFAIIYILSLSLIEQFGQPSTKNGTVVGWRQWLKPYYYKIRAGHYSGSILVAPVHECIVLMSVYVTVTTVVASVSESKASR